MKRKCDQARRRTNDFGILAISHVIVNFFYKGLVSGGREARGGGADEATEIFVHH